MAGDGRRDHVDAGAGAAPRSTSPLDASRGTGGVNTDGSIGSLERGEDPKAEASQERASAPKKSDASTKEYAEGPTGASVPEATHSQGRTRDPTTAGGRNTDPSPGWLSGASGHGVAPGEFGVWRGSPVEIAGTWADSNEGQRHLWSLQPGAEFGNWDGDLDIAIGAIDRGETWSAAAAGSYDSRWRESLTRLRQLWGQRSGTLFIRFAHEMNADWYPWAVNSRNYVDFISAWKRFRAIQQEVFPAAQLVFCVNRESVGTGIDWRTTFPGREYVDVIGVDYYNQWPYVDTAAEWKASLDAVDGYGAPKGLGQHVKFARQVGLPLAIPEWSSVPSQGDSALYVELFSNFVRANAGSGPGQIRYEILFNVLHTTGEDYRFYGAATMPASSAAYRQNF
ncbi:glycosyl hydrolase [Blastococcus montanus]|uniref:glycosyl hydrolase n=1 Tax=Blastococcus montanus TaxID=3144973 RepID=UPI00320B4DC8